MSTSFQTAATSLQKLDPSKRVNYSFGMVLGVEEFLQSDAYFLAKHQLENRLLHGYGTVCGLDVTTAPQLEIQVAPGWAVNPKGQTIHVPQLMCVKVNDWLQSNQQALQNLLGPAGSSIKLCVVLCYRECKTDTVPIAGEPCRTASDSMAPSRIRDSFELMLCLDRDEPVTSPPSNSPPPGSPSAGSGLCLFRPTQLEDDAVRAFATLLSQFSIATVGPFLTPVQVADLVRGLATPFGPPPAGSPPAGPPFRVAAGDAPELLRIAFRTWVTEVRPALAAMQGAKACCPPFETCVLLSEATVTLLGGYFATAISLDDARRPFLIPTRVVQELTLGAAAALATGSAPYKTVAAGMFKMDATSDGPTFDLTASLATPPSPGEFILSFPQYRNPASTPGLSYIVKGTIRDQGAAGANRATFEFVSFDPGGIRVRVLDSGNAAPGSGSGFMAEISQIGGA